jgi:D-alanyl-D-alanine carboxypeptidase
VKSKSREVLRQLGIPADYARRRNLRRQRDATTLISIGRNGDGRIIRLAPRAAGAWRRLRAAATRAGVELVPVSGFRSVARQTAIVRRKLAAGHRISSILKFLAAPGFSEHHTGRALDLGKRGEPDLNEKFARTVEFRWLRRHAARFGFRLSYPRDNPHGIAFEPWHWCWHRPGPHSPPRSNKT